MAEHLSPAQIENYRRRNLTPNELLGVDDHLAACVECRQRIETALSYGAGEVALYSQLSVEAGALSHLTFEQRAGYIDDLLTGDDRRMVKDHLDSCARCAMAADDLRAFRNEIAPELGYECRSSRASVEVVKATGWRERIAARFSTTFFKSPAPAFGAALAVLLLVAAGWMGWRALQKRESRPPIATASPTPAPSVPLNSSSPIPESRPLLAQLNDGGGRVTLDGQGRLSGLDHLPPEYQLRVKQALIVQRVEKSPLLAGLNLPGSSLMGGDEEGNRFAVSEPVGTVILTASPTFRWSKLQGATSYVVEIYDAQFNPSSSSPLLTGAGWTAPPLTRGQVYSWQIKAIRNGQEFIAPQPPAPQAKFRILDQATADEIARARRDYASSHLLLGLLYARAGLIAEAGQEFRALQKANPDSDVARKLLASVSHLPSPTSAKPAQ